MSNVLRTLVFDGQVSLTLADTTEMVKEGARLHVLSPSTSVVFGKTLSAMTFMSACLKGETGEISLSVKSDGLGGEIGVSGNKQLNIRGFIENGKAEGDEDTVFGKDGSITIIRDDGYARPFVGSCAFPKAGGVDGAFEEYFRISEQLPTYFKTAVETDEKGGVLFAGVAVLQPLPFADEETLDKTKKTDLTALLQSVKAKGVEETAIASFGQDTPVWEKRNAQYKCNCSRHYLKRVLVSLGEAQMREILDKDGAVKVHCHYCNTDYEFTDKDADELFAE
ncbi:MAG: Hsp33 family molecular chaperone HslO [Clostridiales bacterium]|nr:Hsp33 family molecular chaperone HslO [Clostridiales bacterium]